MDDLYINLTLFLACLQIVGTVGGFVTMIYKVNKNKILAEQQRTYETDTIKQTLEAQGEKFYEANLRLEGKLDKISEKVEEHSHYEARIVGLECWRDAMACLFGQQNEK